MARDIDIGIRSVELADASFKDYLKVDEKVKAAICGNWPENVRVRIVDNGEGDGVVFVEDREGFCEDLCIDKEQS